VPRASADGKWRQPILQHREIGGDLVAEQIGPGRQHLTELDKGRTDFLESGREPLTGPRRAAAPAKDASQRNSGIAPATGSNKNSASWRARITPMPTRRAAWRRLRNAPNTELSD
jgi:hypothetical protein